MSDAPIRVLLVDDEEQLVTFLEKRLLRKGITVTSVTSAHDAVTHLRKHHVDVAVLDLKMPEMDGLQLLRELKALQPFAQVIILTGHGSFDTALESGRRNAFRFLSKPTEFAELFEVIEEAAAEKHRSQRHAFDEELNELISNSQSPKEILNETRRLREKYEQED